ncbi:putative methyltransferase [Aplochiton taeniatus]
MAYRLFEEKHHASVYQKFRFTPPDQIRELIINYLDQKKGLPHVLAVDLGCGTGQNSRLLAPHFQEVVGIDVSECQIQEARAVSGPSNITYRTGTAEELPFPDGSVDLLTAASAAHWFHQRGFLAEAGRVLKPRGCIALLSSTDELTLHYGDCGDRLTQIYEEVRTVLLPYASSQVMVCRSKLQDLYSAIPFPEKERVEQIPVRLSVSVTNVVGYLESFSMFQSYRRADPEAADSMLSSIHNRFLEEMGVTSPDTEMEMRMEYYCVLASKPLHDIQKKHRDLLQLNMDVKF